MMGSEQERKKKEDKEKKETKWGQRNTCRGRDRQKDCHCVKPGCG